MAKITPLQDRILLRKMEAKKETASGLILPKEQNDSPNLFVVEEVGPLVKEKLGYELKKGDKIIKGQYSGDDIKIEGDENLTIIAAEYVLAKVD
jgi:chaperonin GroES